MGLRLTCVGAPYGRSYKVEEVINDASGLTFKYDFTDDALASEMLKYDSNCGETNRNLILKFHKAEDGVDKILDILNKAHL